MKTRRAFLASLAAAGVATASCPWAPGRERRPRHILLRSSWQTVNIGDIAHTPGALRLLQSQLPGAEVTLWPSQVDNGVREMLQRAFPRLHIAEGRLDSAGRPTTAALRDAWARADLLLHGSGPSVVAQEHLAAWRRHTGKPYGVYGVTIGSVNEALRDLLSAAAFVFCRDTTSLELIRRQGVRSLVMEFVPDATFAFTLRDDERALAYLRRAGLEKRRFVCAIPRLRYTPYSRIRRREPTAEDLRRDRVNEEFKEADHRKLREALIAWVRRTGLQVLACPEMTYQVPLARQLLVDPLPDDVRRRVVWRDTYWRPDEAASVYARALAVVSFECHSPILAAAAGTPLAPNGFLGRGH